MDYYEEKKLRRETELEKKDNASFSIPGRQEYVSVSIPSDLVSVGFMEVPSFTWKTEHLSIERWKSLYVDQYPYREVHRYLSIHGA